MTIDGSADKTHDRLHLRKSATTVRTLLSEIALHAGFGSLASAIDAAAVVARAPDRSGG